MPSRSLGTPTWRPSRRRRDDLGKSLHHHGGSHLYLLGGCCSTSGGTCPGVLLGAAAWQLHLLCTCTMLEVTVRSQ